MHRLSKTRMHLRCPKDRNGDKILRSYANFAHRNVAGGRVDGIIVDDGCTRSVARLAVTVAETS